MVYNKNHYLIDVLKEQFKENNLFCVKDGYLLEKALPSEFNLLTYKTNRCPYGLKCLIDAKICLNYHTYIDRRRVFSNSNTVLNSEKCSYAFVDNKWIDPSKIPCPEGDNCLNLHSIYEMYYHKKYFKIKTCPNDLNGMCKYSQICPFIHKKDLNKNRMKINKEYLDIVNSSLVNQIEFYEKQINSIDILISQHSCEKCNNAIIDNYNIILKCKHFFCNKCINQMVI